MTDRTRKKRGFHIDKFLSYFDNESANQAFIPSDNRYFFTGLELGSYIYHRNLVRI